MMLRVVCVALMGGVGALTAPGVRRQQQVMRRRGYSTGSSTVLSATEGEGTSSLASSSSITAMEARARELREEVEALEASMREEQRSEEEAALDDFFKLADTNVDGVVCLEELRAALRKSFVDENGSDYDARKASRLFKITDDKELETIFGELDANDDGVLQREELSVPVKTIRARLEAAMAKSRVTAMIASSDAPKEEVVEALALERVELFESLANQTGAPWRVLAALCYSLPALDAVPYSFVAGRVDTPLQGTLDFFAADTATRAAVAVTSQEKSGFFLSNLVLDNLRDWAIFYHSIPFSGLLVFLGLSSLAAAPALPRLVRFSARHAIVLDIGAAVFVPLLAAVSGGAYADYGPPTVELFVALSVVAAVFGKTANFIPASGQLATKFNDDYEASIKKVIVSQTSNEINKNDASPSQGPWSGGEKEQEDEKKKKDDDDKQSK